MRNVLGLIGDLANCVGPRARESLKNPYIEKLIIYLRNEPDQMSKEVAEWAFQ